MFQSTSNNLELSASKMFWVSCSSYKPPPGVGDSAPILSNLNQLGRRLIDFFRPSLLTAQLELISTSHFQMKRRLSGHRSSVIITQLATDRQPQRWLIESSRIAVFSITPRLQPSRRIINYPNLQACFFKSAPYFVSILCKLLGHSSTCQLFCFPATNFSYSVFVADVYRLIVFNTW